MRLWHILVLAFLPSLIDCASFTWDKIYNTRGIHNSELTTYQTSSDGTVHLFWLIADDDRGLLYQTILADGTLVNKTFIDLSYDAEHLYDASAQVSADGKHLLVVFDGTLLTKRDMFRKTLFTESFNGGETWSDLKLVLGNSEDGIPRFQPSTFLEKSTGRTYVTYRRLSWGKPTGTFNIEICKKEAGEKSFGHQVAITTMGDPFYPSVGVTNSKTQQYLHTFTIVGDKDLMYTRSIDGGKNWADSTPIGKISGNYRSFSVAMDSKVSEGGLYVQFKDESGANKVVWSNDHGNTFERPITVGNLGRRKNLLSLCGNSGKGVLFVAHHHQYPENSFIKFSTLPIKSFVEIPYPFKQSRGELNLEVLSCSKHEKEDQYSVILVVSDLQSDAIWVARGTLKGV